MEKYLSRFLMQLCQFPRGIVAALMLLAATLASALTIPSSPLSATRSVAPNIMYILDDSGSMMWDIMPDDGVIAGFHGFLFPLPQNTYGDGLYYTQNSLAGAWIQSYSGIYLAIPDFSDTNIYSVYLRSSKNNFSFYNPEKNYEPWKDSSGLYYGVESPLTSADPKKAYWNPADKLKGYIDLTVAQSTNNSSQRYVHWVSASVSNYLNAAANRVVTTRDSATYYPITFYVYDGGDVNLISSYTRYQIRGSTAYKKKLPSGSETTVSNFSWGGGRTVAQETVNFANWFQYYRSRVLAAKASTSLAFADLGSEYRIGFATINSRGSSSGEMAVPKSGNFSSTNRIDFFNKLLSIPIHPRGTPLRGALAWSGDNYKNNYWQDSVSCRRSFSILTTDGYWNGDTDYDAYNKFDNVEKGMGAPYEDTYLNTLADVAMYYWKMDLSTLANNVLATKNNPQTQQHMTMFGLSLGPRGTLNPELDLPALRAGTKLWPDPTASNPNKIDDLWHAAINSRGQFVAASDPDQFRKGLVDALNEITQMSGSQSAGGTSAATYGPGTQYFQTAFDSQNWTGDLLSFDLILDGKSVIPKTVKTWSAAEKLQSDQVGGVDRKIILGGGIAGASAIPFRWTTSNQTMLSNNGLTSSLLAYVRGSGSNEGLASGQYRPRKTRLGDIVGSSPVFVGAPSVNLSAYKDRKKMVYVGANDGMLHGFDSTDGSEVFSYIPSLLLPKLKNLADQNYADNHQYFVDGKISIAEARDHSGNAWGTYLSGSLGRGGESLFLLNVTDPASVSENKASSLVTWEFSKTNDSSLGVLHESEPKIVRLNDDKDYVLAPNGYNSSTGNSALFILPVRSSISNWILGNNYYRLTADSGKNNGLSAITPYDFNYDGKVDLVYAGDLKGNVWKFDLTSSKPAEWKVSISGASLFQALGPNGKPQPIVSAPTVSPHPDVNYRPLSATANNTGLMVFVGTGRYLDSCDKAGGTCINEDAVQSVYGLWDYGGRVCNRKELLRQRMNDIVLKDAGGNSISYRYMTNNALTYPDKGVFASACGTDLNPRTAVFTVKSDGYTQDKSFSFPSFSLSDLDREKISQYWLGWYFDLPKSGERVVSYLDYYKKRVEIQTYIPAAVSSDPCVIGNDGGYLLRVNFQNGGIFTKPRFDDLTVKDAIAKKTTNASSIVGKYIPGSLGRTKIKNGNRFSILLSLTSGGVGGELDETFSRTVHRVTWREILNGS